jgi:hypothetical protein
MASFVKQRSDAPTGFFESEAAGLGWLAEAGGARIARVLAVEPGRIELERIRSNSPCTPEVWMTPNRCARRAS